LPFCPRCGKEVLVTDRFCLSCGQSLERVSQTLDPSTTYATAPAQPPTPMAPVYGMDMRGAYIFDEEGVVRVGANLVVMVLPFILALVLAGIVSTLTDPSTFLSLTVVFTLIALPLFDEWRSRRLRRIFAHPRAELTQLRAAISTPWSTVVQMNLKGRTLQFVSQRSWASITLDENAGAPISAKASATLGPRFFQAPERTGFRFTPARKFLVLTLAFFAIAMVLTIWASVSPFFAGEQARYTTIYNSTEAGIRGAPVLQQYQEIFVNNVQVALMSLVPGFGFLLNSFASYNTGRIIQVIAIDNSVPPSYLLFVLFVLPHSWVEELAYPLAEALGIFALIQWRKQSYSEFTNWRTRGSTKLALGFVAVAVVLALADALEVSEPGLRFGALALWAPVAVGVALVYFGLRSRISKALA
jgi:hypothetical protein